MKRAASIRVDYKGVAMLDEKTPVYDKYFRPNSAEKPVSISIADVNAIVQEIASVGADVEATHAMEDNLEQWVLQTIASDTAIDPVALAKACVDGINSLDNDRWYA